MQIAGYGCEVEWDGQTLTARGTNKMTHFALAGPGKKGDVVVPADQIMSAHFEAPGALTNGTLTVTVVGGQKHPLHFMKEAAADFEALSRELSGAAATSSALTSSDQPLRTFTSHIDGKNATVSIWSDRVEWDRKRTMRGSSSEMVPIRSITSVTTKKDGLTNWAVSIIAPGNTVDFRVSKREAEETKALLNRLIAAGGAPAAPAAPPAPAPAAPAPDAMDQLKKLADLHAAGVLTDEEFASKKADLLDRL